MRPPDVLNSHDNLCFDPDFTSRQAFLVEMWHPLTMTSEISEQNDILIVGGAGYVGSVMALTLLESGHRVRVLDSLIWNNGGSLIGLADHPNFEFIPGDMDDNSVLHQSMRAVDSVVILAGLVGDPITKKYPDKSRKVNVGGVTEVIDTAMQNNVSRIVFASTCSNYGLHSGDELANESTPLSPLSLYAEQKVQIERLLLDRVDEAVSDITILRFATAFGLSPRMRLDLTISHFAKDAVLKGVIEIYDADTWRPYCHVSDMAQAVGRTLSAESSVIRGEVFNVGSTGENYTKRMLGELIKELRPKTEVIYRASGADARNYKVSFQKIAARLNFAAAHTVGGHLPRLLAAMETGVVPLDGSNLSVMGNFNLQE